MDDLTIKFGMLQPVEKQLLLEFLEFLLIKQKKEHSPNPQNYRQNLLKVSIWSKEDIQELEQSSNHLNQWQAPVW